jgi:hypothetical protein
MSQGNQPINLSVICDERSDEYHAMFKVFYRDEFIDAEEQRVLDMHAGGTSRLEQALACIWAGMSWFRCLTPAGNRRTKDLTAQYVNRYGESIAAD